MALPLTNGLLCSSAHWEAVRHLMVCMSQHQAQRSFFCDLLCLVRGIFFLGFFLFFFLTLLEILHLLCQLHNWVAVIPASEALPHQTSPSPSLSLFSTHAIFSAGFTSPKWSKIRLDRFFAHHFWMLISLTCGNRVDVLTITLFIHLFIQQIFTQYLLWVRYTRSWG